MKPEYTIAEELTNAIQAGQGYDLSEVEVSTLHELLRIFDLGITLQDSLIKTSKMTQQRQDLPGLRAIKTLYRKGYNTVQSEINARTKGFVIVSTVRGLEFKESTK